MASKASRRKVQLLSPPLQVRQHTHTVPCSHQKDPRFPEFSRLTPTATSLRLRIPPPITHYQAPLYCLSNRRPHPPPHHCPGYPGLGCGHVSRRPALGALASVGMKPMRAGRISVYLRRVPQSRRRHRTRWAERGQPSVPEGPGTNVSRPPCRQRCARLLDRL